VSDFLTRFKEVDAKAEKNGASLTISLVIPGEIQENMVYTLRKLSDTDDPLEALDTIDLFIDTPEFEIHLERGLNIIHEREDAKVVDEKLREMKFEVNAVDLFWIINGVNSGFARAQSLLERSLGEEKYKEAVNLVQLHEWQRLLNIEFEQVLEKEAYEEA
jgi:hypothetical protein